MLTDIDSFDISKIKMHDLYEVGDNIYKVDLSQDKLKPIMLVLKDLNVLSFLHNQIILSLKTRESIKQKFDDIDKFIVDTLQEKKITKRLKTKFNYRQLTSMYSNKDLNCEILSLDVNTSSNEYKTDIYIRKNKKISLDEATLMMKDNSKVSLVLELMGVVFNISDGIIHLDNVVRQIKVQKIKPKRLHHIEYSFVDSDLSDENNDDIDDIDDIDDKSVSLDKSLNSDDNKSTDNECLLNTNRIYTDDILEIDMRMNINSDTSDI